MNNQILAFLLNVKWGQNPIMKELHIRVGSIKKSGIFMSSMSCSIITPSQLASSCLVFIALMSQLLCSN